MPIHFKASANFDISIDGEAAMALYQPLQQAPSTQNIIDTTGINGYSTESQTEADRLRELEAKIRQDSAMQYDEELQKAIEAESQTDAERLMEMQAEAAQAAEAEVSNLQELHQQLVDESSESTIIDDNSLGGSNSRKTKTSNGGV